MRKRDYMKQILSDVWTYSDVIFSDTDRNLVYMSSVMLDAEYSKFKKGLNKGQQYYLKNIGISLTTKGMKYDTNKYRDASSSYCHQVMYANRKYTEVLDENGIPTGDSIILDYIYAKTEEELPKKFYDVLAKYSPIPLKAEWKDYIYEQSLNANKVTGLTCYHIYDTAPLVGKRVCISKEFLQGIVTRGIQSGQISIGNKQDVSPILNSIEGLDDYLNLFGDTLANKVQDGFKPKFNPETDSYETFLEYYDDNCFYNGINLYPAQRSVIQSASLNLDKSKTTLVVSEMGTGKNLPS